MKKLVTLLCSLPVLLLCTIPGFADLPPIDPTETPADPNPSGIHPLLIVLACAVLIVCLTILIRMLRKKK